MLVAAAIFGDATKVRFVTLEISSSSISPIDIDLVKPAADVTIGRERFDRHDVRPVTFTMVKAFWSREQREFKAYLAARTAQAHLRNQQGAPSRNFFNFFRDDARKIQLVLVENENRPQRRATETGAWPTQPMCRG